ncbi:MAG: hypothetical protein AAF654_00655 [Myxococcota bacterium]
MSEYTEAVRANIDAISELFSQGEPAAFIGAVCGSEGARAFWQRQLDRAREGFRARDAAAFHEDLPVNQAFGLLLLWQRLKPRLRADEGSLVAFVFGEGSRATPLTETECGQKPAILSFARDPSGRFESTVEVAMRCFSPVENFLRRSGFRGVVVKWGDEIQIPTRPLKEPDALFKDADIVRFVSMQRMTDELAANKDWVGVSAEQHVTAFIPRRPLEAMRPLAKQGLLQERDGELWGGVNLGSIGISHALLDVLLDEFRDEVNDPNAERKQRPDLDPQLFTALTVAARPDGANRKEAWAHAVAESPALAQLDASMPDMVNRLRRALDRFENTHNRPIRMVAMDFRDQFWGDIGQHRAMRELFMSLSSSTETGEIARALAGVPESTDERGNRIVGNSAIGPDANVRDSVLIDAQIERGVVASSVLVGSRCQELHADHAFDVQSRATELRLAERSGAYRVVSDEAMSAAVGERITTVFLDEGGQLFRVHEDTDLRDRARNYDAPLDGNPMSFRQAHETVTATDPELIDVRRHRRERDLA